MGILALVDVASLDTPLVQALVTAVTVAIIAVGGLTLLFDLNFLRGRVLWRQTVRQRAQRRLAIAIIVIVLALLDIYLNYLKVSA